MKDEHLQYFKALFEGRAHISWRAWFAQNESALKAELPRAALLRLRFKDLEEAERLLKEAGVEYTPDPVAVRRERHFASFDPSVLDERGRPREDLRRKAYGGVFGMILDGEHDKARKHLKAEIRKIRRKPVPEQMANLADMCFDGETEFTNGNREIGRALLEAVASVPWGDDLLDPETQRARKLLECPKWPPVIFGAIHFEGLNRPSMLYAERMLVEPNDVIDADALKPRYFRLYADNNVALLYPQAHFDKTRSNFDLNVLVKREKDLEARIGGMFSTRPINTGMLGLRYNFFSGSSNRVEAIGYFGKFYSAAQAKLRADFATRIPVYVEPAFTLHRWDQFSSFSSYFGETRPPYVVQRELWAGFNAGIALNNKGLARLDMKYAQTKDSYYQNTSFTSQDTADITEFFHVTTGLMVERNSLNRKQHPNAGECVKAEIRYVNGEERTTPGSTINAYPPLEYRHEWLSAKVTLDKYFLPRGHFKFGVLVEGLYSTQPFFQNYTASVVRAPVFQPTPETKTYFIEEFRATQYLAGGLRTIIAVARNKFDLRLEAYVFQPYKAIVRGDFDQAVEGTAVSERYYIGSGSLIYQSPIGPVWFNTSYIDGLDEPWQVSLNFGYVIFCQRAQE